MSMWFFAFLVGIFLGTGAVALTWFLAVKIRNRDDWWY